MEELQEDLNNSDISVESSDYGEEFGGLEAAFVGEVEEPRIDELLEDDTVVSETGEEGGDEEAHGEQPENTG